MSLTVASEPGHVADLMAQIGDRYLLLIRENYLDDPSGGDSLRDFMVGSLRGLMHAGQLSCVYDLACSGDWREAVVGLHYAVILASPVFDLARPGQTPPAAYKRLARQVGDHYEGELRNSRAFAQRLTARPAFLLFALQNRRRPIIDFLAADRPLSDVADTYAAALVSEELTRGNGDGGAASDLGASALRANVTARLRAEPWHDDGELADSEQRFLRSWRYWTTQHPV